DVGQLLALEGIDVEVVAAAVRANDHSLIDLRAGLQEHRPALFEVPQGIGDCRAVGVRYQHAVATALDRPLVGCVAGEQAAHHAGAPRVGQEFALITNQAAGRTEERESQFAAARRTHLLHFRPAAAHFVDHHSSEFLVNVDDDLFDWLEAAAACPIGVEQYSRA